MAGRKKAPPKRQRAEHTEPTNRASIWHGTSHPVIGDWIDPNDKSLGQVTEKNLASLVEAMAEGERPGKAARKTASVESPKEKKKMEQPKENKNDQPKEAEQLIKKKKTQHGACARGCVRVSVRARVRACACACLRACMRAGTGGIEPVITMTAACRGLLRA
jgi:hypothetical protein